MALAVGAPAFAILPQQGMWSIGSEVNGKPGRGIQLDRQGGDYLILTYFGYREDGSSMFMQASGKLTDGRSFSGDLTEYKNGRAIGGAARDGQVANVLGTVAITFDSANSGTLTLPGEEPQRVHRYQFEDHLARLNNRFELQLQSRSGPAYPLTGRIYIRAAAGQFSMTLNSNILCSYTGDLQPTGDSFRSKGTLVCPSPATPPDTASAYELVDLKVDENGMLSGRLYTTRLGATDPATKIAGQMYLQGVCALPRSDNWYVPSTSICGPAELGIAPLTPADFLP